MTQNDGPKKHQQAENAGLENYRLVFDGPEQRSVMSLVQEHYAHAKDRSARLPYVSVLVLKL